MFLLPKSKSPAETHAVYKSIHIESESSPSNANLNYETGYLNNNGNFILFGNDTLFVKDIEATEETPAKFDYSELMLLLKDVVTEVNGVKRLEILEGYILKKLIERERG